MLNTIRKYSSGWVAQILMGLLVVSFGIWGIAGSLLTGGGSGSVARVGGSNISTADFSRAYRVQLQNLSQRMGQQVTPDQAKMMGLPSEVLSSLIRDAALDEEAATLSLGVSRDTLVREIATDPTFKGANGGFDRNFFVQILQSNGFNEDTYVVKRRADEKRKQLTESISGGATAPVVLSAALHTYQTETRSVRYIVLPASILGDIGAPNPDELSAYYNDNKATWRAPEFRTISLMKADPADVARPADISDADAQKAYDANKATYSTPESRHVFQVVYPDDATAKADADSLKKGDGFDQVLASAGKKPADVDLGVVTRDKMVDPTVADAAFALAPNSSSGVIAGSFGPTIIHVTDVVPASVKAFADVKDQIKADLALTAAKSEINSLRDSIEDARAGGSTIDEIATKNKLTVRKIVVDKTGKDQTGAPVADIPASAALLKAAFDSDVGIDNTAVPTDDGGYAWYAVTNVAAEHDRPLEEVKDKVTEAWKKQETADRLAAKAKDTKDLLAKGQTLDQIAAALKLTVQTVDNELRSSKPTDTFSSDAIKAAFAGPKGYGAAAGGVQDSQQIVLQVTDVKETPYVAGAAEDAQLNEQFANQMQNDLLQQYVSELQRQLGVVPNQPVLQQIIGAT